jgi:hypothetical protein
MYGAAKRLFRGGGRAQWVFVGRQLKHIGHAIQMRRTPDIKVDVHNSRLGCDLTGHGARFLCAIIRFYRATCVNTSGGLSQLAGGAGRENV